MKRRTFIQSVSASTLGLLAPKMFGQDVKGKLQKAPPVAVQSPTQRIINRLQQVADGGS